MDAEGRPKKGRGGKGDEPAPAGVQVLRVRCHDPNRSLLPAPICGEPQQATPGGGRKVEEVAGELREIDREQARRERIQSRPEPRRWTS